MNITEDKNDELVITKKENTPGTKPIYKRPLFIILFAVIVITACISGGLLHKHNLEQDNIKKYTKILSDYENVSIKYGVLCEKTSNLIARVWYNSIFEKSDRKTDKYTKKSGRFNKDFNDSLRALFSSKTYLKQLAKIEVKKDSLDKLYKKAKNYQTAVNDKNKVKFTDAYNALQDLNEQVEAFYIVASEPNGSYENYRDKISQVDNDFVAKYNLFKKQL